MGSMQHADKLRKEAARCRIAASVRTEGSTAADRVLIDLANKLEHEAAEIEGAYAGNKPSGASKTNNV
jgi:hypothetical protein